LDNTQIGISQKNQRDGKSSLFLKMTAKLFVLLQNKWNLDELRNAALGFNVPIVFFQQRIVSPYGMPCYELLANKPPEFAIKYYDDDYYVPFRGSDSSGKRVSKFVEFSFPLRNIRHNNAFCRARTLTLNS
jgi:hypothetical protein